MGLCRYFLEMDVDPLGSVSDSQGRLTHRGIIPKEVIKKNKKNKQTKHMKLLYLVSHWPKWVQLIVENLAGLSL